MMPSRCANVLLGHRVVDPFPALSELPRPSNRGEAEVASQYAFPQPVHLGGHSQVSLESGGAKSRYEGELGYPSAQGSKALWEQEVHAQVSLPQSPPLRGNESSSALVHRVDYPQPVNSFATHCPPHETFAQPRQFYRVPPFLPR